jgi:Coenzyme PQQ synthesis protein D (PqqD)
MREDEMSARTSISDDVSAIMDVDGAIILDTKAGKYYSLNRVAADIWRGIEAGQPLEQVAQDLASRYAQPPDEVLSDVRALVDSMQRLGIVATA